MLPSSGTVAQSHVDRQLGLGFRLCGSCAKVADKTELEKARLPDSMVFCALTRYCSPAADGAVSAPRSCIWTWHGPHTLCTLAPLPLGEGLGVRACVWPGAAGLGDLGILLLFYCGFHEFYLVGARPAPTKPTKMQPRQDCRVNASSSPGLMILHKLTQHC